MTDFPLIYCNGDSYSDENHHHSLVGKTYVNCVANQLGGFAINHAIGGSCNRRIIRTTVYDMLEQRKLNPEQKIIALIGLSFELRSELWIDDVVADKPEESCFRTHSFSSQANWRENLFNGKDISSDNKYNLNKKFFKQYSEGRAFFFSPYAERINLFCDLIMLRSLLDSLNINFLVFQAPKAETLEHDHLLDTFKHQINTDDRFIDFEKFGFVSWCAEQKFAPLDFFDRPQIAHYGTDAHRAFADQILLPKLKELGMI